MPRLVLSLLAVAAALGSAQEPRFYADRAGGIEAATNRGAKGVAKPLGAALRWLAAEQREDGSWAEDVEGTALALAALIGGGDGLNGRYADEVGAGLDWIRARQDAESGRLAASLADHAVATLVLCEAAYFAPEAGHDEAARRALDHLVASGGPTSYDAATCGWSVLAWRVARDAGLEVPAGLEDEVLAHLDRLTDASGHVVAPGNEAGEAMTAVALFARFLLGQRPDRERVLNRHARDLLDHALDESGRIEDDPVLRHFGACAMFQMGGSRHWNRWNQALRPELLATQRSRGPHADSWDPPDGGSRVAATALNALNLEVYFRYGPLR